MSNEKQQTGLDWFITQLQKSKDFQRVINEINQSSTEVKDVIAKARTATKNQILIAYDEGYESSRYDPVNYYRNNYGGNE